MQRCSGWLWSSPLLRILGDKNSLQHCWFSSLLTSWERFVCTLRLIEVDFYLPAYFPVSNPLGKPQALVETSSCETPDGAAPGAWVALQGHGDAWGCEQPGSPSVSAWSTSGCPSHSPSARAAGWPWGQTPPRPVVPLAQGPVTNGSSSGASRPKHLQTRVPVPARSCLLLWEPGRTWLCHPSLQLHEQPSGRAWCGVRSCLWMFAGC